MGKTCDYLTPDLQTWLKQQKIFFVATAPLDGKGHVNCSPKGGDTFRVLNEREVAYLDLTGSGVETIAHIKENKLLVIMFCAFEGSPQVVRLHGRGEVVYPSHRDFPALRALFPEYPGARAVIRLAITRIGDSCGYAVPFMDFVGERDALDKWAEKKGADGLDAYRTLKNHVSIDGVEGYSDLGTRA